MIRKLSWSEAMEGVFLSAMTEVLEGLIKGEKCLSAGEPFRGGIALVFRGGMLVLSARPEAPSLWWGRPVELAPPPSPAWGHHLEGGIVKGAAQQGADRVLVIRITSGLMYGAGEIRLVFEATGRNANIILVRDGDNRILACLRKVLSDRCRYRTLAPGQVYVPPPPSGLHPGEWSTSEELRRTLEMDPPSPGDMYRLMEGVGPVTARAVLRQADTDGRTPLEVVRELEDALLKRSFSPWMGPEGPLPVRLGPGEVIEDPLAPPDRVDSPVDGIRDVRLEEWTSLLKRSEIRLARRLAHLEKALGQLAPEATLRLWAGILLTSGVRTRGSDSITLPDWEGREHTIPLRRSRSPVENAARYFRKASNSGVEERNIRRLIRETDAALAATVESLLQAPGLSVEELDGLLSESRKRDRKEKERITGLPQPTILTGGWRCFAGRNAADNDRITFTLGRRGDIWFHARGIPGAHVLLKLDGRMDNPPRRVIIEAAALAARGSGTSRGVVPVDHTCVQYVRRMKKGKPGQVFYTREKTIFVDLDRLRQSDRGTGRGENGPVEG